MNGLKGKYVPSSSIKTEPLTDKYTIEGNIGRGKYAVVKKCVNNETKDVVAAKFIRKRRKGKSAREEILREVVMLEMAFAHPRLVDLLEVYETSSELILITEYCEGGELFHECVIEESFKEEDVIRLVVQILEGLVYLHEQNIVHLDLKPQNILLTKPFPHGNIKICDLGFACLVHAGEDIRDIIGTADYVAPEVLDYEPLSIMTDMWSMGVLTYVMLTAFSPFAGENQQETFCNISSMQVDFPEELFSDKSDHCQDFISRLLVKNAKKRLTARQCLEHPWLQSHVIQANLPPTVSNSNESNMEETSSHCNEKHHQTLPRMTGRKNIIELDEKDVLSESSVKCSKEIHIEIPSDFRSTVKSVETLTEISDNKNNMVEKIPVVNGDMHCKSMEVDDIVKKVAASEPLITNSVSLQNDENRKNEENHSKVTYSVNKTIVLKPLSSSSSLVNNTNSDSFISEQTEITQFSKTFEKQTELSSPTGEQKPFPNVSNDGEISSTQNSIEFINPFNGKEQKVIARNKVQRISLPSRLPGESIKNKDKDESFKRRSMEIPVKRRKSETVEEDEDLQKLASLNHRTITVVEELTALETNSASVKQ
ncbi:serine/threonine-protein kinase 17B [Patella vulgata]|uniref:serine/threonine-protein kinase 17B n=1 Tax=Patella vulgata TaxID=6465 RepID=UPI00217FBC80|nr:serine/threonine-protein kinase 17B [Patella vulgata]